jgi:hypothetical protein
MATRSNRRTSCEEDYRSPVWIDVFPGYPGSASGSSTISVVCEDCSARIAPEITSACPPDALYGSLYFHTYTATGSPAVVFTATGLPPGMFFDQSTATLFGTPTASGWFGLTVTASNGVLPDAEVFCGLFRVLPIPPAFTSACPPDGVEGTPYSFTLTADGSPTLTFDATTPLPQGLSINPVTGVLSGTPVDAGVFVVTFRVCNNVENLCDYQTCTIEIVGIPTTITSSCPPAGTQGVPYSFQVVWSPLNPWSAPVTFGATGLPPTLVIDPVLGTITGTPVVPGSYPIVITAFNGVLPVYQQFCTLVIASTGITPAPAAASEDAAATLAALSFVRGTPLVDSSGEVYSTGTLSIASFVRTL